MYVAVVPNRNSPPAAFLRESFREDGQARNRTLANLSHWPAAQIDARRMVLQGQSWSALAVAGSFDITRCRPHGHIAAVLAAIERLDLAALTDGCDRLCRRAILALIAARILEPGSKSVASRACGRGAAPAPGVNVWL